MDLLEVMMQQQMKSNVICCLEIARNHAEGSGESLNLQVVRMDVNGCDISGQIIATSHDLTVKLRPKLLK